MKRMTYELPILEAKDVDPAQAHYIMSRPGRTLGNWDSDYIEAVTGYTSARWACVFALVPDFKDVWSAMETEEYLKWSGRHLPLGVAARRWVALDQAKEVAQPPSP